MREWILRLTKSLRQRLPIFALLLMLPAVTGAAFGRSGRVTVTVHLRDSTGSPLAGETVLLERLPDGEYEPAACVTGVDGVCAWQAAPGLYQLFFERPLDELTQLALAEGGLRGYGITVGDTSVSYHFTFHHDGLVYFDSEPLAPVPAAVIPSLDDLHLEGAPPVTATAPQATATAAPDETGAAPAAETPASATALRLAAESHPETPVFTWLLFLSIAAGLLITVALPLMLRLSPPVRREARRFESLGSTELADRAERRARRVAHVEPGAGSRRMDDWTAGLPHRTPRPSHRESPSSTSTPEPARRELAEPEDSDA